MRIVYCVYYFINYNDHMFMRCTVKKKYDLVCTLKLNEILKGHLVSHGYFIQIYTLYIYTLFQSSVHTVGQIY